MSDSVVPLSRLRIARAALEQAEKEMHLEKIRAFPSGNMSEALPQAPVLHIPRARGRVITALVRALPPDGWAGIVAVGNLGWEAAALAGINLHHVMYVKSPRRWGAQVCALLLEVVDVLCVEEAGLSRAAMRQLSARARRDGKRILTTVVWPGISRSWDVQQPMHAEAM